MFIITVRSTELLKEIYYSDKQARVEDCSSLDLEVESEIESVLDEGGRILDIKKSESMCSLPDGRFVLNHTVTICYECERERIRRKSIKEKV